MPDPSWTDDHSRLVAEAAPAVGEPADAAVDRVWNLVAARMATSTPARRSRRRMAVGAGVAAIVLGVSGVAAADMWHARTGVQQTDAESIRLGGPGELIDPRGADYEQVLREEMADIPFPSDEARDMAVADQVKFAVRDAESMRIAQARGDEDWRSVQITGGMRAEAARAALCAWSNSWAVATTAGDDSARAAAIEVIEAAPSWPAITDVDPDQTITPDATPFGWLPLVVAAARGHDLEAMGRPFAQHTRCIPELVPDLPAAVPAASSPTCGAVAPRTPRTWRRRSMPLHGVAVRTSPHRCCDGPGSSAQPRRCCRRSTETMLAAIGRLSPGHQEVLRLVEWERLTPAELATALGVRAGTARVRLHRARMALAADPAVRALVEEGSSSHLLEHHP